MKSGPPAKTGRPKGARTKTTIPEVRESLCEALALGYPVREVARIVREKTGVTLTLPAIRSYHLVYFESEVLPRRRAIAQSVDDVFSPAEVVRTLWMEAIGCLEEVYRRKKLKVPDLKPDEDKDVWAVRAKEILKEKRDWPWIYDRWLQTVDRIGFILERVGYAKERNPEGAAGGPSVAFQQQIQALVLNAGGNGGGQALYDLLAQFTRLGSRVEAHLGEDLPGA